MTHSNQSKSWNVLIITSIALTGVLIAFVVLFSLSMTVVIPPEKKYLQRITPQYANIHANVTFEAPDKKSTLQAVQILWSHRMIWWPSITPQVICVGIWNDDNGSDFAKMSIRYLKCETHSDDPILQVQVVEFQSNIRIAIRTETQIQIYLIPIEQLKTLTWKLDRKSVV